MLVPIAAPSQERRGDRQCWAPTAGELRALKFDSGKRLERDRAGPRRVARDGWTFSAYLVDTEITRTADRATLSSINAKLRLDTEGLAVVFDPAHAAAPDGRPRLAGWRDACSARGVTHGGLLSGTEPELLRV